MKKIIAAFLIFKALSTPLFAQNAFYDSKTIVKNKWAVYSIVTNTADITVSKPNANEVLLLLSTYLSKDERQNIDNEPDPVKKFKLYQAAFKNNPFVQISGAVEDNPLTGLNLSKTSISSLFANSGSINVTNIADGLAKFLVERVKEELTISFFQKFKDDLNKQKDLQILFPATWAWLKVIDTQVYNFTSYITLLREAFIKDLQVIIPNLQKVINDPRYNDYFDSNKPLRSLFNSALIITQGLQAGKHAGDILNDVAQQDFKDFDTIEPNLKPTIKTLDLLVKSLLSKSKDHYLVPFDSIKTAFADKVTFTIYLGLLYQMADTSIYFDNDTKKTLRAILTNIKNEFDAFRNRYQNEIELLVSKAENVQHSILNIKKQNAQTDTKATYADYYNLYNSSITLIEEASNVPPLLGIQVQWKKEKDTYFFVARKLGEIYLDVNQKKYASAILSGVFIYDTLFKGENVNKKIREIQKYIEENKNIQKQLVDRSKTLNSNPEKTIEEIIKQLSDKKEDKEIKSSLEKIANTTIKASDQIIKDNIWLNDFTNKTILHNDLNISHNISKDLLKYGNFAAQIAAAENSDQVEEAIEAVALPAGSSRIKRETPFNVALNGYLGFFGGGEQILSLDKKTIGTYGITAPIGISISRGHSIFFFSTGESGWKNGKCGWSTSLFISIIDIGALASFRATQTQTSSNDTITTTPQIPNIQFKNIISPGAFISLGIPKCPLSINLGAQIGPNLRSISVSSDSNPTITNNYADQMYWRFSISLVADIPIINFYTKSR